MPATTKQDLGPVFKSIKILLKKYEQPLVAPFDNETRYELWTKKEVVIDGRKKKEIYFAGIVVQSNYVGFYYMPVYANPEMKKKFDPKFLKLLKGKACFHFKEINKELLEHIRVALEKGFEAYNKRGWV